LLAAALTTKADVLVTEHLKHFPSKPLAAFELDVRITDDFFADTIMPDEGRAVPPSAGCASGYSSQP
jgi:hypothetical protein